jgi:hypothetical protein
MTLVWIEQHVFQRLNLTFRIWNEWVRTGGCTPVTTSPATKSSQRGMKRKRSSILTGTPEKEGTKEGKRCCEEKNREGNERN